MKVVYFPEAEAELDALPPRERSAMLAAVEKLQAFGDRLPFPHSSAVRGTKATLRELRPRGGRSPWRAFYRRVENVIAIGAIGPEAKVDPGGFRRAVVRHWIGLTTTIDSLRPSWQRSYRYATEKRTPSLQ